MVLGQLFFADRRRPLARLAQGGSALQERKSVLELRAHGSRFIVSGPYHHPKWHIRIPYRALAPLGKYYGSGDTLRALSPDRTDEHPLALLCPASRK